MYCVEIWGNAKDIYLSPLIKLQKKSVRIITHSHYLSHSEPLFSKLNIFNFDKLVQYRISLAMFKLHHCQVPESIKSLFQLLAMYIHTIPDINIHFILLERITNLYIIHFLFKLYRFS